jgi:Holliday junction resolvasome RuvABC endonuclease subunit
MSNAIAIMPCLGILHGAIFRAFANEGFSDRLFELQISSWKKVFLGKGRGNKKEVQAKLKEMGFDRFKNDDESDAVAMALASFEDPSILKKTKGRIRGTKKIKNNSSEVFS